MNWSVKRAQRAASLRARLDSDLGLPPAKSPPTVAQVARVGAPLLVRPQRARPAPPSIVRADEESIDARLYRKRPPGVPLDIWLDILAEEA